MPIYEYECTKCGHRFEVIQKVSDAPRKKCEKCKSKAERLVSSPAIQFKGSGWYVTDYARKGSSGEESGTKDAESSKSSGKTGKTAKSDKDTSKSTKKAASSSK